MKKKSFLLILIFTLVLTGCMSTRWKLATGVEDVVGIWTNLDYPGFDPGYLILRSDGTFTIAPNPDGTGGISGKFWFEDRQMMLGDAFCTTPEAYQVRVKTVEG